MLKINSRALILGGTLVAATLTGCGGGPSVKVSSSDATTFDTFVAVTDAGQIDLNIKLETTDDSTLSAYSVSSDTVAALNDSATPGSKTFQRTYNINPQTGNRMKVVGTQADGSTEVVYTFHRGVKYMRDATADKLQIMTLQPPTGPLTANPSKQGGSPAILFVHGTNQNLVDFHKNAEDAAKVGYFTASMDFRNFAGFGEGSSHMPDQVEDVRCALQYLTANSGSLGIDPNAIGIVGYSVGAVAGLLASFADTSKLPNNSGYSQRCKYPNTAFNVAAVAAISPAANGIEVYVDSDSFAKGKYKELLGLEQNDNMDFIKKHYNIVSDSWGGYTLTAAQQVLVDKMVATSPLTYLNKNIPVYYFHGNIDTTFPCHHSYDAYLASGGASNAYIAISDIGHLWGDYIGVLKKEVRSRYMSFFDKELAKGTKAVTPSTAVPDSCKNL